MFSWWPHTLTNSTSYLPGTFRKQINITVKEIVSNDNNASVPELVFTVCRHGGFFISNCAAALHFVWRTKTPQPRSQDLVKGVWGGEYSQQASAKGAPFALLANILLLKIGFRFRRLLKCSKRNAIIMIYSYEGVMIWILHESSSRFAVNAC